MIGKGTISRRGTAIAGLVVLAAALLAASATAALQLGYSGSDVLVGRDNDNAANTFIQPVGVAAKQHLDNTDIIRGGPRGDLLVGVKGGDLLDGDEGDDILIGGLEKGQLPNSDLIDGANGRDINIWAPGDGSDAFEGGRGYDTHITAPLVQDAAGNVALFEARHRQVPHVTIDSQTTSCTIERVPSTENLGFEFVTRFLNAAGGIVVTIRLQDVEQVLCPSPNPDTVRVADLTQANPTFVERPFSDFAGSLVGEILQVG
jgi:hypothetical protein